VEEVETVETVEPTRWGLQQESDFQSMHTAREGLLQLDEKSIVRDLALQSASVYASHFFELLC
jgi:hypothetical protein